MKIGSKIRALFYKSPRRKRASGSPSELRAAYSYARNWPGVASVAGQAAEVGRVPNEPPNALREYFECHRNGRGIWKWMHYFDIYHRHLSKFVGREVHIVEIGIF